MNNDTPKVQVVIDKDYYDRLVANQKTPEQAREMIKGVARTLRALKKQDWRGNEMADFLENQIEKMIQPPNATLENV